MRLSRGAPIFAGAFFSLFLCSVTASPTNPPAALTNPQSGLILLPDESAIPTTTRSADDEAIRRGFLALQRSDLMAAESAFNDALRIKSDNVGAFVGLAEIDMRRNQPGEAQKRLAQALAFVPKKPELHVALGRAYTAQGQFAKAEGAYRQALDADPTASQAYLDLGSLFLGGLHDPQKALENYRKAVELQPQSAAARFGLAMAFLALRDKDSAIGALQAASGFAPNDPGPHHAMGRILAGEKQLDRAVDAFTAALKVAPDFLPALADRADLYAETRMNEKAAADYERLLAIKPNDSVARVKLGMIYQRLERYDAARAAYLSALDGNPNLAVAYNNLAMMLLRSKGSLNEALAHAKKAVSITPKVPQFHDTLGRVYWALGDKTAALEALRQAAALDPPQADILFHLGQLYEETGQKKSAVVNYRKALAVDKEFPEAGKAEARLEALSRPDSH